ncbi:MAG: DUF4932 domain-containing protein [Opitutaceae bacterium]
MKWIITALLGSAATLAAHTRAQTPAAAVSFVIDPRVELVATAQYLSGYADHAPFKGRINPFDHPYLNDLRRHFAGSKTHPALARLAALRVGGSDPIGIAVHLSGDGTLTLRPPLEGIRVSPEMAEAYATNLREFAAAVDFEGFLAARRSQHDQIIAEFRNATDVAAVADALARYCGPQTCRFRIVLAPLLGRTSFGPKAVDADGTPVFYAILPAQGVVDGRLVFGERDALAGLLAHEFGHSFVNPLVEKHWAAFSSYSGLLAQVQYSRSSNYGRDWKIFVCESIVRAVAARIILAQQGGDACAAQLARDRQTGFAFGAEMCRALERYERNRDTYPTLESYLPELAVVFASLQQAANGPAGEKTRLAPPTPR